MRFSSTVALIALAGCATSAAATSTSPCTVKYNFDSSNPLDIDLKTFASVLQQGMGCAEREVRTSTDAFASLAKQGATTMQQTAQRYGQSFGNDVAAEYMYMARLYGQAKTFFATYETQLAASDVGQAVTSFNTMFRSVAQAVEDFKPYAPFVASAWRAAGQLNAAEGDFANSMQKYGSQMYAMVQPAIEDTEEALNGMMAAMAKAGQATGQLATEVV